MSVCDEQHPKWNSIAANWGSNIILNVFRKRNYDSWIAINFVRFHVIAWNWTEADSVPNVIVSRYLLFVRFYCFSIYAYGLMCVFLKSKFFIIFLKRFFSDSPYPMCLTVLLIYVRFYFKHQNLKTEGGKSMCKISNTLHESQKRKLNYEIYIHSWKYSKVNWIEGMRQWNIPLLVHNWIDKHTVKQLSI